MMRVFEVRMNEMVRLLRVASRADGLTGIQADSSDARKNNCWRNVAQLPKSNLRSLMLN